MTKAGRPSIPINDQTLTSNPNVNARFQGGPQDLFVARSASGKPRAEPIANPMTLSQPPPQINLQQQQADENGLPDLSAMMFPSADPFAYPNQPMTTLDSRQYKQEPMDDVLGGAGTFVPHGSGSGMYANLEGQLFDPLPPYLMQGPPPAMTASPQLENVAVDGINMTPEEMYAQQVRSGNAQGMNLDEIFGDDWNNVIMDPGYRR